MKTAVKKTDDWANFILRRISNGVEWDADELKDCYAVITFFEESFIPLYEGSNYYVMTDTGGTVANRTKK